MIGPLIATLQFKGTGTGTFDIEDVGQGLFTITLATVNFTGEGTLSSVPEPNSFLLMGTGIFSLLGLARKRIFAS